MKTRSRPKASRAKHLVLTKAKGDVTGPSLDTAVRFINRKVGNTVEQGAAGLLEIGQYVFKHFFDDSATEVHVHAPLKHASLRALADHPELQLSRSGLHNAVHLAMQERQLKAAGVSTSEHLLVSHKVELLRIQDLAEKKRLIGEVARLDLSVRALRVRIDDAAGASSRRLPARSAPSRLELTPLPPALQSFAALQMNQLIDADRVQTLSAAQKERLRAVLYDAEARIRHIIGVLNAASAQRGVAV